MEARDTLLKLIDDGILNADDILKDILVNILDIDTANECAKAELIDNECYDDAFADEQ